MKLPQFMAQACYFAQEHINDKDAWPTDTESRIQYLQCVSFQMACFFAQNTMDGGGGVEWEIVMDKLAEWPMRTLSQWENIIENLAQEMGGWKEDI